MEYQFQDSNLSLIHIPISHYPFFLQPILRLLFGEDHDEDAPKIPWTDRHKFLNISITPVECSVFCSRELADRFFRPLAETFNTFARPKKNGATKDDVLEINPEDFVVVRVDGGGIEAGQRVLELTSPLALAGISIFFVTTYFSDYILVPSRARHTVTQALQQRGFVFSKSADAFVSQLSPSSPTLNHKRNQSSGSSFDLAPTLAATPITPPAQSVPELQTRTFARLRKSNIVPAVDRSLRLTSCAGHKDSQSDGTLEAQLRDDLMQVLLATCPAPTPSSPRPALGIAHTNNLDPVRDRVVPDFATRFLTLTLTDTEPISVLLEHRLLPHLGRSLLGSRGDEDVLVPITLDLRDLPLEASGIVCGVAGRLARGTTVGLGKGSGSPVADGKGKDEERGHNGGDPDPDPGPGPDTDPAPAPAPDPDPDPGGAEISFLSTARAGTVIVKESDLDRAVRALAEGAEVERS